jgi:hypothetical protein
MPYTKTVHNDTLVRGDVLIGNNGGRVLVNNVNDYIDGRIAAETEHGLLILDPEALSSILWASEEQDIPNTLPSPLGESVVLPGATPLFAHVPKPPDAWEIGQETSTDGPAALEDEPGEFVDVLKPKPKSTSKDTSKGNAREVGEARHRDARNYAQEEQRARIAAASRVGSPVDRVATKPTAKADKIDPKNEAAPVQQIDGSWRWSKEDNAYVAKPSEDEGGDAVPFRLCFEASCEASCGFCEAKCGTGCPYVPSEGDDICDHRGTGRFDSEES